MTTDAQATETTQTETSTAPDLGSLSFSDYERARRGQPVEAKPATSAPEAKTSEQRVSADSETTETEETEHETSEQETAGAESEKSDTAAETEQGEAKAGKKKSGFQKRIDKLNSAKAEAQREADYWKRVALEKQAATEAKTEAPKVETKTNAPEGKPKPEDFETHAAYVEALTDWKVDQKEKAREAKEHKSSAEKEQKKRFDAYLEKKAAFAEKTPDFDEVISEVDDIPVSPAVSQLIIESENGPALAYELAKNRAEYARICKLPPHLAAKEMGKLEAKIEARTSEAKETKKTTSAPNPLTPVGNGKGAAVKKTPEEMSFAEYEQYRRAQMKRKGA